mmetsp:Transcript_48629/g.103961  ORF Transcript_48629/g.103961 Transcript_48629/m.103961 type:complete len:401 (-) Transcript_48629:288-1490(-)|eukprot:CAMPEP_0206510196 /NCGR_PEP_ID=MMETSP0324_2-20121206/59476_1 /ASSEMBLY_ACC=CAM_ASM_000836 /TAXON_ID=2866 /ORGANISM="Crypthecodinium cohnii, Strain Seligo" /LENGTH=400 /DNA_ID=CAMNT_0054001589 /DNA_START=59 /DNA_END=1261 /DNA_ORIENTATION=-
MVEIEAVQECEEVVDVQDGQADEDAAEGEDAQQEEAELDPFELKCLGNEAYARGELSSAVDFWNTALRQHVQGMSNASGVNQKYSPISPESQALERSLYLNLAQGYLKLGDAAKALRACQVVLHENATDVKALYRAAEASLELRKYSETEKLLEVLQEVGKEDTSVLAGAQRLSLKLRAGQKADERRQRAVAKKMCAAADFSEGRPATVSPATALSSSAAGRFAALEPETMLASTDIAAAAAQAAQKRSQRLSEPSPPPAPTVNDLDAFKAKIFAKTNKYNANSDQMRRKRETAQHSVKLEWLREGKSRSEYEGFRQQWHEELEQAQAAARAAEAATLAAEELEAEAEAEVEEPCKEAAMMVGDRQEEGGQIKETADETLQEKERSFLEMQQAGLLNEMD